MSLKVSPLTVEEESELDGIGHENPIDPQLGFLVNRGPKHKTVFSPAFKDEAVTRIRGKITVSF